MTERVPATEAWLRQLARAGGRGRGHPARRSGRTGGGQSCPCGARSCRASAPPRRGPAQATGTEARDGYLALNRRLADPGVPSGAILSDTTREHQRRIILAIVESVRATDAGVSEIRVRPEARPFFEDFVVGESATEDEAAPAARSSWLLAPPDGLEPPTRTLGRCRSIH